MKSKKGFNWKARQVVQTDIDNSAVSKIKLDSNLTKGAKYDECNALVIPSKKRKTKKKNNEVTVTRILSKKQRKKLEKIVERKKKKQNRAALLESLSRMQPKAELMSQLTSIASVQTKGLKRYFAEQKRGERKRKHRVEEDEEEAEEEEEEQKKNIYKMNSIAGSQKRLQLLKKGTGEINSKLDPNVVGFESSDSDEDEANENEEEEESYSSIEEDEMKIESETEVGKEAQSFGEDCVSEKKIMENIAENIIKNNSVFKHDANHKQNCNKIKADVKPAIFVPVNRNPKIQEARMKLPILAEEQVIMEAIAENPVVILAGETGSGKTTQVPQFLYEAGYSSDGKIIGVTEPRRVAAISMSRRVAEEMNLSTDEVSYLIRFEGNASEKTKIKFMTDGVLLREVQSDFLLKKYSVIILDEAHERSVYTDILIGLLSRIVPLRNKRGNPLKLIIMSATLRLEDFTENSRLFKIAPPVIKVESRQFPVTIHFNKRTAQDYVNEAFNKACKIHTQLPEGGILIFLTGQQEVNVLVRKLRRSFPMKKAKYYVPNNSKESQENNLYSDEEEVEMDMNQAIQNARKARKKKKEVPLPDINLDNYSVIPGDDTEGDLLEQDDEMANVDSDSDDMNDQLNLKGLTTSQPMWVLPLYSLLPSSKQAKVFEPPPEGCRLCVVATNVAETSLTIPNVKYVIDSGRMKTRVYDKMTGVSAFTVTWTSKAAANQRAGRAGRTGPGHCYRLYSSAVFNDEFEQFSAPEIQRKPIDDLLLQMKTMNIDKVINFPFPSPPDETQLKAAERRLILLGALEEQSNVEEWNSKVTPLGYAIAAFPVAPRFGKMLALSHQHNLLPYTICIVAALSVQEVLLEAPLQGCEENDNVESKKKSRAIWAQKRRSWAGTGNSLLLGDPMVLLRAVGAAEYAGRTGDLLQFCTENGLRHKAIVEIRKLRLQLTNEVNLNVPELDLFVDPKMSPPTDAQARLLRQLLLAGMPDQVANKVDLNEIKENEEKAKWKHAYRCAELEDPVCMHSASVLRKNSPEWVVYQEVFETTKLYMRGVTAIEPEWLPIFAPSLCNLSPPLAEPPPRYDKASEKMFCYVTGTFGRAAWQLPIMEIEFPPSIECYKWFACFLLEGDVFPKLKKFRNALLSAPKTMVKTWAKLQPRTDILLKALAVRQVNSKSKLEQAWEKDPTYLLSAYQKWVPESVYNEVALIWPPT